MSQIQTRGASGGGGRSALADGGAASVAVVDDEDMCARTFSRPKSVARQSKASRWSTIILPSENEAQPDYRSIVVNLSKSEENAEVPAPREKIVQRLIEFLCKPAAQPAQQGAAPSEAHGWHLDPPNIVFHVTGTARPIADMKELVEIDKQRKSGSYDPLADFMRLFPNKWFFGRVKEFITSVMFDIASHNSPCWIIDGGTDCGIMKLIGDLHKNSFRPKFSFSHPRDGRRWHPTFPLIGVADLGQIDGGQLPQFNNASESQTQPNGGFKASDYCKRGQKEGGFTPDEGHTHQMFLCNGGLKCSPSNHDASFMSTFFTGLSKSKDFNCSVVCRPLHFAPKTNPSTSRSHHHVLQVHIIFGGGINSLRNIVNALLNGVTRHHPPLVQPSHQCNPLSSPHAVPHHRCQPAEESCNRQRRR